MFTRRLTLFGLLVTLLTAWLPTIADAQSGIATAGLKAAFLYNFTKFTEWPAEVLPTAAPLVLCMAGDLRVQGALEALIKGKNVEGHPLVVRQVKLQGALDFCHLLYAEDLNSKRALDLLKKLNGAPVLSVSDFKNFAELGGSAHLFIEDGRMRFAVNFDATQRIKLRLSTTLLSLAKIVKDDLRP